MDIARFGDIGTIITLTITDETGAVVDISGATTKTIYFVRTDGSVVTKSAVFSSNGTDGKVQYTTVANDLNQVGNWKAQAYVDIPSGKWYSSFFDFSVEKNAQ